MNHFRILVSDKLGAVGLERLAEASDVVYDLKTGMSHDELLATVPLYDALIVRSETKVTADVLEAATDLKVVGRAGMGVDNIDVAAATLRGIVVMNTPGANSMATAEQTLALMLAASRHTPQAYASMRAGEWRRSAFVGTQLYEKVLGIIGLGRIGRLVAERAKAFGMEILAYDPYISEEVGRQFGVTLVELDDLLAQADYITLHTALSPETGKLINADTLRQMKDGVIIVNVARGKLVDEPALIEALQSGKVRTAALDVFVTEPLPADSPFLSLPNVIHTPHLGASTLEAQHDVAVQIVDQVLAALRGTDFANAVNMPFQLDLHFAMVRPYLELAEKIGRLHASLADGPIQRLEIEVKGEAVGNLVRAIASGLLKGLLSTTETRPMNYINAPALAADYGIAITQTVGINGLDYSNLIACRAHWDGGQRLLAGVLFAGGEPRIVRVDGYSLEAKPEGIVLVMQNQDVPGVIGQVGTILSAYEVNIGEWRLGRDRPGGEALSFINLDSEPPEAVLDALSKIRALTRVKLVRL